VKADNSLHNNSGILSKIILFWYYNAHVEEEPLFCGCFPRFGGVWSFLRSHACSVSGKLWHKRVPRETLSRHISPACGAVM
jgi:hypothetical protein